MDEARLQELYDRELIKELKARYFRHFDFKEWDAWGQLFAEDAKLVLRGLEPVSGREAIVSFAIGLGVESQHLAGLPEITFDGPDEAHAIWVLRDYLEWPSDPDTGARRGMLGYGHERDTYRRVDGEWKIAVVEVSYLRRDSLSDLALPTEEVLHYS